MYKKKDKNIILPPDFINVNMMKRIIEISQFQYVADNLDSSIYILLIYYYFINRFSIRIKSKLL